MQHQALTQKARTWTSDLFDKATRHSVSEMIEGDVDLLAECFQTDLEFGTGGLRGIMGVGTARINRYTMSYATQGLAAYLKKSFMNHDSIAVAIAYDSRNNSAHFARIAAEVLSANGIVAYLYEELRPTPILSFAVRELGCQAGIVITASHNPKEYNGYKVYWEDGAQLVPPHDKGVIDEVRSVTDPSAVASVVDESLIRPLGADMDMAYLAMCQRISMMPKDSPAKKQTSVCFTSLHGTGITLIPQALDLAGFEQLHIVESQATPDGDFPTVDSPNPEERSAMNLGLQVAEAVGADVLFGTDPDADRVGMAVRDDSGSLILLNGNEAAALLIYYLLQRRKVSGDAHDTDYIAKTIVTSDLLSEIAAAHGVGCEETLTGFKYIAEVIRNKEGQGRFIGGGEESYGYLIGEEVRDKDAVLSTMMLAEMVAWAKEQGSSPYHLLKEVRAAHGFYKEALVSLVKKGLKGKEEIAAIMEDMRRVPPAHIGGVAVASISDYSIAQRTELATNTSRPIDLPKSNVLQFHLADGSKVTARPSGTEPKIKYYISVRGEMESVADHDTLAESLDQRINALKTDLGI